MTILIDLRRCFQLNLLFLFIASAHNLTWPGLPSATSSETLSWMGEPSTSTAPTRAIPDFHHTNVALDAAQGPRQVAKVGPPSAESLAAHGVKVRDFAYESTLAPIKHYVRRPTQTRPSSTIYSSKSHTTVWGYDTSSMVKLRQNVMFLDRQLTICMIFRPNAVERRQRDDQTTFAIVINVELACPHWEHIDQTLSASFETIRTKIALKILKKLGMACAPQVTPRQRSEGLGSSTAAIGRKYRDRRPTKPDTPRGAAHVGAAADVLAHREPSPVAYARNAQPSRRPPASQRAAWLCLKRRSIRHGVGMPCAPSIRADAAGDAEAFLGRLRRRTHTRVGASTHPAHRDRTIFQRIPARCVARLKRLSIRPGLGCLAPVYGWGCLAPVYSPRGVSASNTAALPTRRILHLVGLRGDVEGNHGHAPQDWDGRRMRGKHTYIAARFFAAIMREGAGAVQCPRGPQRARGRSVAKFEGGHRKLELVYFIRKAGHPPSLVPKNPPHRRCVARSKPEYNWGAVGRGVVDEAGTLSGSRGLEIYGASSRPRTFNAFRVVRKSVIYNLNRLAFKNFQNEGGQKSRSPKMASAKTRKRSFRAKTSSKQVKKVSVLDIIEVFELGVAQGQYRSLCRVQLDSLLDTKFPGSLENYSNNVGKA
ncbi:hypothetical protein C8F04DRAFT_1306360 [Mycena alexandri]|uniref:Uncharacterized protein n=1 Tax=Mycena alexandri TaxID=1745969 RepID=A0AAD6SBA2_9AGAR|nr:hypothetical protein C8F04DRAFT_1306360 [Mycena alexandri]